MSWPNIPVRAIVLVCGGALILGFNGCQGGPKGIDDSTTPVPPAPTYAVSGFVTVDPSSPATSLMVTLDGSERFVRQTYASELTRGWSFLIDGLTSGRYTVTPRANGYVFSPMSRMVKVEGASVDGLGFSARLQTCDVITGFVTGDDSGFGTEVDLVGPDSGTVWSRVDPHYTQIMGNFEFRGVRGGTYTVTPTRPGYSFFPRETVVSLATTDTPPCDAIQAQSDGGSYVAIQARSVGSRTSCTGDGWCWESPKPNGAVFRGLWGSGPNDVWAIGDGGTVMHWDGVELADVDTGVRSKLHAVWGSGPNDVWVVGVDVVTRWNGTVWAPVPVPWGVIGGISIWGSGPNDVYFVSSGLLHWNGNAVTEIDSDSFAAVSGSGPNNVWALSRASWSGGQPYSKSIKHWDGKAWSEFAISVGGVPQFVSRVWVAGVDDVWVWASGNLLHGDGRTWTKVGLEGFVGPIAGSGPTDVWAILGEYVAHWDGSSWRHAGDGNREPVSAIWAKAPDNAWMAGRQMLRRWDGANWSSATSRLALVGTGYGTARLWGSGANDLWLFADNRAFKSDGVTWERIASPTGPVTGVGGSGPDDVWVVGQHSWDTQCNAYHFDGSTWSAPFMCPSNFISGRLWVTAPDDAWIVGRHNTSGDGRLLHWDGVTWAEVSFGSPAPLIEVAWGTAPDDLWVGGGNHQVADGEIQHWDGKTWTVSASLPGNFVRAIWGIGPSDVWALAGKEVLHWNGTAWLTVASFPGSVTGTDIWASGPEDVWAVGAGTIGDVVYGTSVILHWDGLTWTSQWSGNPYGFSSIWGAGPGNVWAAGLATEDVWVGWNHIVIQRHQP